MGRTMSKERDEFFRQFRTDVLNSLTDNDGENFRKLYKAKLTKKAKKDLERLSRHPKLKPLVPH